MTDLSEAFLRFLTSSCRCHTDNSFLLAVSGGIDSMVMLDLFRRHELNYAIAHCNFQLRGNESEEDEEFIHRLALKNKTLFFGKRFDTLQYAGEKGISVQMAARELRYGWFNELIHNNAFNCCATAHHKDDSVETFLINLSRGTGISGLTGINPRSGNLIRPLLFASREEIRNYARNEGIAWREDSSNASDKYLRNRIRHKLLPEWNSLVPGIQDAIIKTASFLRQAKEVLDEQVELFVKNAVHQRGDRVEIEIERIKMLSQAGIILPEFLQRYGFNYPVIEQMLEALHGQPGKRFLSRSHEMIIDRSRLIIQPYAVRSVSRFEIPEGTLSVRYPVSLSLKQVSRDENFNVHTDAMTAILDQDRISFPLVIRQWKEGDFFCPLGMKGRKKLSDFFIDAKIPLTDKNRIWVMEAGGDIVWIIGWRIDDRYKITRETKNILQIKYDEEEV